MALRADWPNFSKGEIGPELYSRVDVQAYNASVKQAMNVKVRKYGGLTKRAGTRFIAKAYSQDLTLPVRMMPFVFNDQQGYVLELGQAYMRPMALGGMVLGDALAVTAITNAANAQVSAAYHGYVVGDQVFFTGILGMVQINGHIATVLSVPDANTFTVDLDTTGYGAFTGSTGGVTNSAPPAPSPVAPVVPPVTPDPSQPVVGGGGSGGSRYPNEQLP